ncbi:MAG TPA: hypothetical protein VGD95_03960 [Micavibrio sp.]
MVKDLFTGAINERVEKLYYHAELDAYLVTGQSQQEGGRRAYVEMRSAHALTAEQNETLAALAEPVTSASGLKVCVSRVRQVVQIYDQLTQTSSEASVATLSPAVREKFPPLKVGFFDRLGM